jgi:hypothetical protein
MSYATLLDALFALDLNDSELAIPDIKDAQEATRDTRGRDCPRHALTREPV